MFRARTRRGCHSGTDVSISMMAVTVCTFTYTTPTVARAAPPGWVQLDVFRGGGVDVGVHNGEYYDLTPFLSPELKVRFLTNNAKSMENGDGLQWDNFSIFAW